MSGAGAGESVGSGMEVKWEEEEDRAGRRLQAPQPVQARADLAPELAAGILATVPALVVVLEPDFTVQALNREAERVLGLSSAGARGRNWFASFVPAHSRDRARHEFEQGLEQDPGSELTSLVKCADGTERQIRWQLKKLEESRFGGDLIVALGIDITEREWKEEHRKLLSSMVEQSTEGMAVVDPQGSIIFANRACAEMHGYEPLELIGEDKPVLAGPEGAEPAEVAEQIEKKGHFTGELSHRRRNGEIFPVMVHVSQLKDDTGRPMGFVWTMQDLTEQKKVADALRQSRERLRAVVESAPVVLWAVDSEGRFTLSEGKGLLPLGLKPGEAVGRSVFDLYGDNPEIKEGVRRALAGESFSTTVSVGNLAYDATYSPIRDSRGAVIGAMGVATDVTERARAEEALRLRARQQTALARFGQRALGGLALDRLFEEALTLVVENLEVELAKVLELCADGESLLLRAGIGWKPGCVGTARVSADRDSQAGYTLLSEGPVIVDDLSKERRFSGPPLLTEHGVVSGMSVIIQGRGRPFGVLGAHSVKRRKFSFDDVSFLQALANVLAATIDRKQREEEHARLIKAVERTSESIMITDAKGQIQYVNPAFERITGYSASEALGQNPRMLKSGRHDESFYRKMWGTLTTGKTWSGYITNRRKDGSLYREQATITPVTDESGRIVNYVAVKRELPQESPARPAE